jgi:CheY-like chemotaxis protein
MNRIIEVFIIEDNRNARETIMGILSSPEVNFTEAEDWQSALTIISERTFDVIILDLGIPEMNGLQILKSARQINPQLAPVIMLTGYLEEGFKREAEQMGVFEYITKAPLPRKALRDAVIRATNSQQ